VSGPNGPLALTDNLGDHRCFANFNLNNKSRTVALIIHKDWQVHHVYRDNTGSLVGVVASRVGVEILLVSAYLPTSLDFKSKQSETRDEVHSIYATLREWTNKHPLWLVGGDLNETRSSLDRIRNPKT